MDVPLIAWSLGGATSIPALRGADPRAVADAGLLLGRLRVAFAKSGHQSGSHTFDRDTRRRV